MYGTTRYHAQELIEQKHVGKPTSFLAEEPHVSISLQNSSLLWMNSQEPSRDEEKEKGERASYSVLPTTSSDNSVACEVENFALQHSGKYCSPGVLHAFLSVHLNEDRIRREKNKKRRKTYEFQRLDCTFRPAIKHKRICPVWVFSLNFFNSRVEAKF